MKTTPDNSSFSINDRVNFYEAGTGGMVTGANSTPFAASVVFVGGLDANGCRQVNLTYTNHYGTSGSQTNVPAYVTEGGESHGSGGAFITARSPA